MPVTLLNLIVGNRFGEAVTSAQGMKIAAAEALWDTEQPAGFSLFQIGGFSAEDPTPSVSITVPRLLSYMATGSFDGEVQGINQLQAQQEQQFGPGNYIPDVEVIYWSIRVMAFLGVVDVPRGRRRGVAVSQAHAREVALVPADGDRRDGLPVHRGDLGVDPHRDGAPALDRPGAAEDRGRALAEREHGDDRA